MAEVSTVAIGVFKLLNIGNSEYPVKTFIFMFCIIFFQVEEEPESNNPDQAIRVKFMRRTPGGLYVWPEPADVGDQPVTDIICPVDPPTVHNKRIQFKFDDVAFKQIKDHMSNVKSIKFI